MKKEDYFCNPEILFRLVREGMNIAEDYALAKIGKGVLTYNEVKENYVYWKDRFALFCENCGWDSHLVEILNDI